MPLGTLSYKSRFTKMHYSFNLEMVILYNFTVYR